MEMDERIIANYILLEWLRQCTGPYLIARLSSMDTEQC